MAYATRKIHIKAPDILAGEWDVDVVPHEGQFIAYVTKCGASVADTGPLPTWLDAWKAGSDLKEMLAAAAASNPRRKYA